MFGTYFRKITICTCYYFYILCDSFQSRDLEPIPTCCVHCIQGTKGVGLSNQASSYILTPGSANMPTFDKFVIQGSPFVRLAGLSGASAVALGAYGAHSK